MVQQLPPHGHEGYYLVPLTLSEADRLYNAPSAKVLDVFLKILRTTPVVAGKPMSSSRYATGAARMRLPRIPSILIQVVAELPHEMFGILYDGVHNGGTFRMSQPDRILGLLEPYQINVGQVFIPHFAFISDVQQMMKPQHVVQSIDASPSTFTPRLETSTSIESTGVRAKQWSSTMAVVFLAFMLLRILARLLPRRRSHRMASLRDLLIMLWRSGRYSSSANGQWRLLEHALSIRYNPDTDLVWKRRPRRQLPDDMTDLHELLKVSMEHGWKHIMMSIIQSEKAQELLKEHKQQILQKMRDEGDLIHQLKKHMKSQLEFPVLQEKLAKKLPSLPKQEQTILDTKAPPAIMTFHKLHDPAVYKRLEQLLEKDKQSFQQKQSFFTTFPLQPVLPVQQALFQISQIRTPTGVAFTPTFSKGLQHALRRMFPVLDHLSQHQRNILENYIRYELRGNTTKRGLLDVIMKPDFNEVLSQFARDCLFFQDPSILAQKIKHQSPSSSSRSRRPTIRRNRTTRLGPVGQQVKQQQVKTQSKTPMPPMEQKTQYERFWQGAREDPVLAAPSQGAHGPISRKKQSTHHRISF